MVDVRFGSKADMCAALAHVCFTRNSDIKCDIVECPLWAKSGHRLEQNDLGSDKKVNSVMSCRFRGYERRAEIAARDQVIVTTA